jgi:hypothetical protein
MCPLRLLRTNFAVPHPASQRNSTRAAPRTSSRVISRFPSVDKALRQSAVPTADGKQKRRSISFRNDPIEAIPKGRRNWNVKGLWLVARFRVLSNVPRSWNLPKSSIVADRLPSSDNRRTGQAQYNRFQQTVSRSRRGWSARIAFRAGTKPKRERRDIFLARLLIVCVRCPTPHGLHGW